MFWEAHSSCDLTLNLSGSKMWLHNTAFGLHQIQDLNVEVLLRLFSCLSFEISLGIDLYLNLNLILHVNLHFNSELNLNLKSKLIQSSDIERIVQWDSHWPDCQKTLPAAGLLSNEDYYIERLNYQQELLYWYNLENSQGWGEHHVLIVTLYWSIALVLENRVCRGGQNWHTFILPYTVGLFSR